MYLIGDIGNTRIKSAIFDDNHNPIYFNANEHNALGLFKTLREIKKNFDGKIDKVFYSSVSFKVNDMFVSSVQDILKKDVYRVTHKDIQLKGNMYEPKDSVGIDRLLSTYASICLEGFNEENKYASIVIDMGTATTISIMLSDFVFLGGMIMPGTKTSSFALSRKTSLPYFNIGEITGLPNPINNNVEDALIAGSIYNTIGAANYSVAEIKKTIKEKYNIKSKIFLTGGISNLKLLKCKIYPYLVLQGIYFNMIDTSYGRK